MSDKKTGIVFVVSGPSAVGKTSVVEEILKTKKIPLKRFVTCTTRKIRNNEVDGIDYNFMSVEDFLFHKNNGDFIESSEVYGNYYGIMLPSILEDINHGNNLLLIINWNGYLQLKEVIKKDVFGFFIVPPSFQDLEKRIRMRNTDSEEIIGRRLQMANEDMQHQHEFDFCFENVSISKTANNILKKIHEITNQ